jgi:tRNA pseudouridine38-40 synthase
MARYFLEVAYQGTAYSGFQTQQNANTIQAEIEKAYHILQKEQVTMTGSSRTDAGVHARQNFFHFDSGAPLIKGLVYKLNAILPGDIVVKNLVQVNEEQHCRFDATGREYSYYIYRQKDPFLRDRAFFFPYNLDLDKLQQAAGMVTKYDDFTSFSKRNTQAKTFICRIHYSKWLIEEDCLVYRVSANRFLRGMVRALTATMLRVGRNKISVEEFVAIINAKDCTRASFAVPPQGLFLDRVIFPEDYFSL